MNGLARTSSDRWALALLCILAACSAIGLWRAWDVWSTRPSELAVPPNAISSSPAPLKAPDRSWAVTEQALAATLVDELFPAPPPEQPPPPPPRLDVQLVAILGGGDKRRAFVRDVKENAYLELAAGGTVREHVQLESVEENAAVFRVAGQPVRLELAR